MIGLALDCLNAEPVPTHGPAQVLQAIGVRIADGTLLHERRRRATDRRWFRMATIGLALVAAAFFWLWWIDRDPNIRVPEPRMPSPNAFTSFRVAGLMLTNDEEVGKALRHRRLVTNPSRTLSRQDGGNRAGSSKRAEAEDVPTPAEQERILERNSRALRLLRAGFDFEYREPPARSFRHVFPHYATFRSLARLLALEAMVHERHGRIAQANASDLDAVDLGMRIRNGAPIIGALVGYACSAIGRTGLWERLDRMSAAEARQALARLDRIEQRRIPVGLNLEEEMWFGVAGLLEVMRDRQWRWKLGDLITAEPEQYDRSLRQYGMFVAMLPFSKSDIIHRYMGNLGEEIHRAGLYPDSPVEYRQDLRDPLNQMLLPVFSSVIFKDAYDRAETGLLRVSLAVRAFRLERGRLPSSLAEIERPGYLYSVPRDPFARESATTLRYLRYAVRSGHPIVYSVGPDFSDNGGAPIGSKRPNESEISRTVTQDSVGDIVAGINTP
jgi:hypothetical protein